MNRQNFYENLKTDKGPKAEEIAYFSQNIEGVFSDLHIESKDVKITVLNRLTAYLPCSRELINIFLEKFYKYPKNEDISFFPIYKKQMKREKESYEVLLEDMEIDKLESEILFKYRSENSEHASLEEKFDGQLKLITKKDELLEEKEEARREKIELTEENSKKVDEGIEILKEIEKTIALNKKKIISLGKKVKGGMV